MQVGVKFTKSRKINVIANGKESRKIKQSK